MPGIYISYPFCRQKCSFCNFASDVASEGARAQYQEALLRELDAYTQWPWLPETLYFGGGTPSLMPDSLFRQICARIPRQRLSEVTVECAPATLSGDTLEAWRECGVNRVSLGVQSFVPAELRWTGRRHSAETVQADVERLQRAGIENINLDLIAGLPGQTAASWDESLGWIERLAPAHVSVYIFESDDDSRLGRELSLGGVRYGAALMPSDEAAAGFYERAVERLAALGIERYEISNFARRGWESRHNLKYWQLEPYLGFGLDAHSYDGQRRWSNSDNLSEYVADAGLPQDEAASETDRSEEHFFVGLRLMSGIEPAPGEWERFAEPIAKWTAAGMLERDGARLKLSAAGVLVSNEIFQEFVECPQAVA